VATNRSVASKVAAPGAKRIAPTCFDPARQTSALLGVKICDLQCFLAADRECPPSRPSRYHKITVLIVGVSYLSGKIRNPMLIITSDVITSPHTGGTEGSKATKYAAK
jgi:hypothetical protein